MHERVCSKLAAFGVAADGGGALCEPSKHWVTIRNQLSAEFQATES